MNTYAPADTRAALARLENSIAADAGPFLPFTAAQWDPVVKAVSTGAFLAGVNAIERQAQHDQQITSAAWRRVALSGGLGLPVRQQ